MGLAFGAIFSLLSLFWIVFLQIPINVKILMCFGLLLLFLYYGVYFGISFSIARYIGIWSLPFIISGLEFVRGIGEIGFPWLSLGYSQARYPLIIQQASIYGIYGLSFWLALVNVAIYKFLRFRKPVQLIVALVVFVLPVLYGLCHMKGSTPEKRIIIGIIQPNIDPNLKFTRAMREETFDRLLGLSRASIDLAKDVYNDSSDLIIWPESATPIFLKSSNVYQKRLLQFVDSARTAILS